MNPGQLRERITLQASGRTSDGGGGWVQAWTDVDPPVTVAAKVKPLSKHERLQAMQTDAQASHLVTIRWRADVTAKHRWKWVTGAGTRYLRVVAEPVNQDEHRRYLEMFATEDRD